MLRFLLVILMPVVLVVTQRQNLHIVKMPECGTLREDQYYNLQKTVEDNEFPWIARLYDTNNTMLCLGVLISERHLLAPAHCLEVPNLSTIELGNCRKQKQCLVRLEKYSYEKHPGYGDGDFRFFNDIGVVRIEESFTLTEFIQPICLPSSDVARKDFVAEYHILTGDQFAGRQGGRNYKMITPIVGTKRCMKKFFNSTWLQVSFDKVLCASTCDNGSKYLSGSILMGVSVEDSVPVRYYLIGMLVAGKSPQCVDDAPDIFQRVDRYKDWILETIDKLERN